MTPIRILAALVILIAVVSAIISRTHSEWFKETLSQEDGFLEWLTALTLAAGAILCFLRAFRINVTRGIPFLLGLLGLGVVFILGCGEELSWGQRIFSVESPEWFRENNLQEETNFHNLVVADVKLNKLIFSQLLALGAILYLIVFPILATKSPKITRLADKWAVPIPCTRLVILTLVLAAFTSLATTTSRKHELVETVMVTMFTLIIAAPQNRTVFLPPINRQGTLLQPPK